MTENAKIIYCIGSPKHKREAMRREASRGDLLFIDSDEVVCSFCEKGKTFFVLGDYPFGSFKVREYVCYNGALLRERPLPGRRVRAFIKKATGKRVSLSARVKGLEVFCYRALALVTALTPSVTRVAISFDGTTYTPQREKQLRRLVQALSAYEVLVLVGDSAFIPSGATVRRYLRSGEVIELSTAAAGSRIKGKRLIRAYAARRGIRLTGREIKGITVSV